MINLKKIKTIYIIGIGGSGMSGIAEILLSLGYKVTGSDISKSKVTDRLIQLGIKIVFFHHVKNIHSNIDLVVKSNAIPSDNIEILTANEMNIPIVSRNDVLKELINFKYKKRILISGTHGKTTTTAAIIHICFESGFSPTFINGEIVPCVNSRSHIGSDNFFIAEIDESHPSFIQIQPTIAVITNIDFDHINLYEMDFEILKRSFIKFLKNVPNYGYVILCVDNDIIVEILSYIDKKIITYGFNKNADFYIQSYQQNQMKSSFCIRRKHKIDFNLKINTNVPGHHNALNITAAVALATEEKIPKSSILSAISKFPGVTRRFENLGTYNLKKINGKIGNFIIINDYGHHPTEISLSIDTIRMGWPKNRLIMIFEPHRYTRIKNLYNNFVWTLLKVNILFIMNIFSAGELPISGIDSKRLFEDINRIGRNISFFSSDFKNLLETLISVLEHDDVILIQSAGIIGDKIKNLLEKLYN